MFRPFAIAAVLLAAPLTACSVTVGAGLSDNQAVNQCQTSEDCGGGSCVDGLCAARDGAFESLLLSVTPSRAGGTYYLDYPSANGDQDVNVPAMAKVEGSLILDTFCEGTTFIPAEGQSLTVLEKDRLMPADVTFRPSHRTPGVPTETYLGVPDANGITFTVNLPPDDYDIYIHPYKQAPDETTGDTPCAVPPRLLLQQSVPGSLELKLSMAPPSKLGLQVVWAKDASAAGWVVDLVDPSTGYAISVPRTLRDTDVVSVSERDQTYQVTLDYAPTYGKDAKGTLHPLPIGENVIRLTPPEGMTAPVLLAQLTGAEIGSDPGKTTAQVRQVTPLPKPVTVKFWTEVAGDHSPAEASVMVTGTDLPGFADMFTSFTRTVAVEGTGDDAGEGTIQLLPGSYRVVATPPASCNGGTCLGTTETTWLVKPDVETQDGRVIALTPAVQVSGRAVSPQGEPAVGAFARAIASSAILDLNVMNKGDAASPILPRAASVQVDSQGYFEFGADTGTYDFRVEPDLASGFAWYVRPQVAVGVDGAVADDLYSIRLPLPVVYGGTVAAGTGENRAALPSALIRAFVYLSPSGKVVPRPEADSVAVQVAETRADAGGAFTLLVPPNLAGR